MALFGEEIDAEQARRLGLGWEVVEDADVESRALELAPGSRPTRHWHGRP